MAASENSPGSIPPPGKTQTGTSRRLISKTASFSGEKMTPATLLGKFMRTSLLKAAVFLTLLASCYKDHLYVQQEWVDRDFLASTHVQTPDPRQICPPTGQRLLVAWRFPLNLIQQGLNLHLTTRLWDNTEEVSTQPMTRSHGYEAFNFFDGKRILTYKIEVTDSKGDVVEVWEHHFWTKLIDVDLSNTAVSSQPRQASVIETP